MSGSVNDLKSSSDYDTGIQGTRLIASLIRRSSSTVHIVYLIHLKQEEDSLNGH